MLAFIAFPNLDLRLSRFLKVETYFWKLSFNVAMPCQWSLDSLWFSANQSFPNYQIAEPSKFQVCQEGNGWS